LTRLASRRGILPSRKNIHFKLSAAKGWQSMSRQNDYAPADEGRGRFIVIAAKIAAKVAGSVD
jgi:hypothetical protein